MEDSGGSSNSVFSIQRNLPCSDYVISCSMWASENIFEIPDRETKRLFMVQTGSHELSSLRSP